MVNASPIGAREMDFATLLSSLMAERGLGVRALSRRVPCDPALVSRLAAGRQRPSAQIARRLDDILAAGGELAGLAAMAPELPAVPWPEQARQSGDQSYGSTGPGTAESRSS